MGVSSRLPALLYSATGKKEYLAATEKILDEIYNMATHLSGSPVSVTEYLAPVTSTAETEYCSYAFYHTTYYYMSYITGESKYGDRIEEMFYNGAQGARKKDEKAIAYLNAPNQIYATETSSSAVSDMQVYAPCYPVSCCPVNSVALLGNFICSMMLCDENDNIYMNVYGPCSLKHNEIEIDEITEYPFRDKVKFIIKNGKNFDIFLRIPKWCKKFEISINGKKVNEVKTENGFVCIHNKWNNEDVLIITFKEEIEIVRVEDDFLKRPIAIKRGALLYSLHISEKWNKIQGHPTTPFPQGWNWYSAEPDFEEAACRDAHEKLGMRRNQISWNVALDENISPENISVEFLENDGYVWENPKIRFVFRLIKHHICVRHIRREHLKLLEKSNR